MTFVNNFGVFENQLTQFYKNGLYLHVINVYETGIFETNRKRREAERSFLNV